VTEEEWLQEEEDLEVDLLDVLDAYTAAHTDGNQTLVKLHALMNAIGCVLEGLSIPAEATWASLSHPKAGPILLLIVEQGRSRRPFLLHWPQF
jgi:hypothetical protein